MAEESRNDITVNGGGTIPAGTYENVTVNGGGTVSGALTCTALRINGAATVQGDLKAATVNVNGSGTFGGAVHAIEVSVNGDASVAGGLGVTNLIVRGNLSTQAGINATLLDMKGRVRTPGDLVAETIKGEGALEAADIRCKSIDLGVYGPSKVKTLEADTIVLRAPGSLADVFMFWTAREFRAETIRGSEVWLANTAANIVSAGNVTVGEGCRIGLVHYSGTYAKQPGAQVTEERKAE